MVIFLSIAPTESEQVHKQNITRAIDTPKILMRETAELPRTDKVTSFNGSPDRHKPRPSAQPKPTLRQFLMSEQRSLYGFAPAMPTFTDVLAAIWNGRLSDADLIEPQEKFDATQHFELGTLEDPRTKLVHTYAMILGDELQRASAAHGPESAQAKKLTQQIEVLASAFEILLEDELTETLKEQGRNLTFSLFQGWKVGEIISSGCFICPLREFCTILRQDLVFAVQTPSGIQETGDHYFLLGLGLALERNERIGQQPSDSKN